MIRSATRANPASICIETDEGVDRLTIGTTGTLVPPTPTWLPDPGTPGI